MEKTKTYVILDTMVYLHYRPVDELCLTELLDASDVTVLVPRITLQELDGHKNTHQSAKIRERARNRLAAIQKWIDAGEIAPRISIKFGATRPKIDFAAHGLEPRWNDDQLLATVIEFRDEHPEERVALLTQDTGLLLSAKQFGIEAVMVPDDKRLPPEEDPLAKENQELKNQLLRLKTARPNLILRFRGDSDELTHAEFELEGPVAVPPFDKEGFLAQLRIAVPEIHPNPTGPLGSPSRSFALSEAFRQPVPDSEYKRYNEERETYLQQMLNYVDRTAAYLTRPERTLLLELELRNVGATPGEDIDIYVHFPDGFGLYSEDDLPQRPCEPSPPEKPQTDLQRSMANLKPRFERPPFLDRLCDIGPSGPFSLRKTDSYELTDNVARLKHGCSYAIRKKLYFTLHR